MFYPEGPGPKPAETAHNPHNPYVRGAAVGGGLAFILGLIMAAVGAQRYDESTLYTGLGLIGLGVQLLLLALLVAAVRWTPDEPPGRE